VFAVGSEFAASIRKVESGLDGVQIVVIGEADEECLLLPAGARAISRSTRSPKSALGRSLPAVLVRTTGRPKGVELTYANLKCGRDLYPEIMGLGPDSVSVVPMPPTTS